jgi:hypothetical protein
MRKSAKYSPAYPPKFVAEAIWLARTSCRPRRAIPCDLGLTAETLRLRLKQAEVVASRTLPAAATGSPSSCAGPV